MKAPWLMDRSLRLGPDVHQSIRTVGIIAGAALLLMAVLAAFGNFVAVEGLVTSGDAARTAQNIRDSENLFRLGIMSLFLVVVLDVVVAWALYRVFRPVSEGISMLAAWLRLAYSAVFMIAIAQLPEVLRLLGNDGNVGVFTTDQLQAQALSRIDAFTDIFDAGLVLFGFHLLVLGYLAYRSGFVPRFLGILLAVAGAGYVFDSLAEVLSHGSFPDLAAFTFIGEFLLALWLVIWGSRLASGRPALDEDLVAAAP